MTFQPSRKELQEGRHRLVRMMRRVRPEAHEFQTAVTNGLLAALQPHITFANLEALIVHRGSDKLWSVDFLLHLTPPGVERVFGTPHSNPLHSKSQALVIARDMLAKVVRICEINAATPARPMRETSPDYVFYLYGFGMALPEDVVTLARDRFRARGDLDDIGIRDAARASIANVIVQVFPAGFSMERYRALPNQAVDRLLRILIGGAAVGVWSYPAAPTREPTKDEHLTWARTRAMQYVAVGELQAAVTSFACDLAKHPQTRTNDAPLIAAELLRMGRLSTPGEMRSFLESVT